MPTSKLSWELAKKRASYIRKVREFFYQREVIEVETPILSNGTVTDIHLDAFSTDYEFFSGTNVQVNDKLYLQTSPEFAMKRLLSEGYGSIYQISKAFRREPFGRFHNPEFTMLEWYRIGFNQDELISEVSELLQSILECGMPEMMSYQEAFLKTTGLDPLTSNQQELKDYLHNKDVKDSWINEESEIDTLLQHIFSEFVEVSIGRNVPCFIYDFPSSQAALAKISSTDARVSHRFECYYKGVELANGYNELLDHHEQVKRFNRDIETRRRLGKEIIPIDFNFINAMKKGLPQCSGVALGIDRLLMIAFNQPTINDVITYGIETA